MLRIHVPPYRHQPGSLWVGTYLHAIVAAAILGVRPVVLDVVGFGLILGRGTETGVLAGVFGLAVIVFGSLVGAGFALSGQEPSNG